MAKPAPKAPAACSDNKNLLHNVLFGGVAGVIGQASVYPLYTIRTHLHLYPATYTNFVQAAFKIVRQTGLSSLYRGLRPALIGVFPEKAIKLSVNDYLTAALSRPDGSISMPMAMAAGAGAGLTQVIATNPMEVLMINQQTSTLSTPQLISKLGIRGLYKHVSATLLRDIPFSIIFFPMNASLRLMFTKQDGTLPTPNVFLAGILAGTTAAAASTPADVIKTNLQAISPKKAPTPPVSIRSAATSSQAPSRSMSSAAPKPTEYSGIVHCARSIYAARGIRGFFAGVGPRVLTISPLFGVTMFMYEIQRRLKASGTI
ncbi:unnamed protein product [Agarophyton chilense]|eukprot:gb/GEZJ01001933.1/.p1 GENE.gb/GEZJ01001933.1/~~gb/GEZJ01001933.1/.p1  ORF type:complete len:340 (+),score=33.88 gb/GEZJ01001933.1/:73-1020(+)